VWEASSRFRSGALLEHELASVELTSEDAIDSPIGAALRHWPSGAQRFQGRPAPLTADEHSFQQVARLAGISPPTNRRGVGQNQWRFRAMGWLWRASPAMRSRKNSYSTVIDTGVLYTFPQLSQACMTVL
jgi:hypothetical protein